MSRCLMLTECSLIKDLNHSRLFVLYFALLNNKLYLNIIREFDLKSVIDNLSKSNEKKQQFILLLFYQKNYEYFYMERNYFFSIIIVFLNVIYKYIF